ncbi:short chain dehydrogenase [Gorgonomyces haynaldii]|nr:short chain dehydrogenase [Gorgonomyces haynaldii]
MKTAIVFGASRGMGRSIAEALGKDHQLVICSKTLKDLHEIQKKLGNQTIAVECDVRDSESIKRVIQTCLDRFGRIDRVVYNAGAIFWNSIGNTPLKRFMLMQDVNIHGFYAVVQEILPIFNKQQSGRLIVVSPPIYSRFIRGKAAYAVGKIGMTVLALGLALELPKDCAVSCLWPATAIQSAVTDAKNVPLNVLRKPDIFTDAVLAIFQSNPSLVNGKTLIDEDFLRSLGVQDFEKYSVVPGAQVPRMMPKAFPDLAVQEQDDRGVLMNSKL